MCQVDETKWDPKIPFPLSSQLAQVSKLEGSSKARDILFLCSAGWCREPGGSGTLSLTFWLSLLVWAAVSLKLLYLPSDPHSASPYPGIDVCLPQWRKAPSSSAGHPHHQGQRQQERTWVCFNPSSWALHHASGFCLVLILPCFTLISPAEFKCQGQTQRQQSASTTAWDQIPTINKWISLGFTSLMTDKESRRWVVWFIY